MTESPLISEVCYYALKPNEKGFLGIASMLYDQKLSLNSISVYQTLSGDVRLLFPNTILKNGRDVNVFYPIDKQTYELMRVAVARKIEEVQEKRISHVLQ